MSNFENIQKTFSEMWNYARAGACWVPDADGVLREYTEDSPPITYRGILLENARTNLLLHSRNMTDAAWSKVGTGTCALNGIGADGAVNTAVTIDDNDISASYYVEQTVIIDDDPGDQPICASIYVTKTISASVFPSIRLFHADASAAYCVDTDDGTATVITSLGPDGSCEIESCGDYWRVAITLSNAGQSSATMRVYPSWNADASANQSVTAQGACVFDFPQVEDGSPVATSAIVTGASTASRGEPIIYHADADEILTTSELTAFIEYEGLTPMIDPMASGGMLILATASTYSRLSIVSRGSDLRLSGYADGGAVNFNASASGKVAISYSLERDEFVAGYNGDTVADATTGQEMTDIASIYLCGFSGGSSPLQCYIRSAKLWKFSMSQSDISSLTAV
jgi:hypothetical protein